MKKTILTVALVIATIFSVGAKESKKMKVQERFNDRIERIMKSVENFSETENVHAVAFYDVDRIVIKNEEHARVRILNSNYTVVYDGTEDVDVMLEDGDYYVVSSLNIVQKYISYTCPGY